jgi:hypothetical protein
MKEGKHGTAVVRAFSREGNAAGRPGGVAVSRGSRRGGAAEHRRILPGQATILLPQRCEAGIVLPVQAQRAAIPVAGPPRLSDTSDYRLDQQIY